MGSTPQADTPENVYFETFHMPSRASNAADRTVSIGLKGQAIKILSVDLIPEASQAGSATNYADVKIVNLGSGSAGTTVVASKTFSAAAASIAANTPGAFTLGSVVSKASAEHFAVSYGSQGNGIALVAHALAVAYRYL